MRAFILLALTIVGAASAAQATSDLVAPHTFVPVCERQDIIKSILEKAYQKKCNELTSAYLEQNYLEMLIVASPDLEVLQAGDLGGLHIGGLIISNNPQLRRIAAHAMAHITLHKTWRAMLDVSITDNPSLKVIEAQAIYDIKGLVVFNIQNNSSLQMLPANAITHIDFSSVDLRRAVFSIQDNPNLKHIELAAVRSVSNIEDVILRGNASLESLDGLVDDVHFPSHKVGGSRSVNNSSVRIVDNPTLIRIGPNVVSRVTGAHEIRISGNPNLKILANGAISRTQAYRLDIYKNPQLAQIDPKFIRSSSFSYLTLIDTHKFRNARLDLAAEVKDLYSLSLDLKTLSTAADNAFGGVKIERLSLNMHGAQLPLPRKVFSGLGLSFNELDLSDNELKIIPARGFTKSYLGLDEPLQSISLMPNSIEYIAPAAFEGVVNKPCLRNVKGYACSGAG